MGSLVKAPKSPAPSPQVVYYTSPTPTVTDTDTSADSQTDDDIGLTPEEESEKRTQSLLRRERGRLGTVITGFRGLLGLSGDNNGQRKTLLGE